MERTKWDNSIEPSVNASSPFSWCYRWRNWAPKEWKTYLKSQRQRVAELKLNPRPFWCCVYATSLLLGIFPPSTFQHFPMSHADLQMLKDFLLKCRCLWKGIAITSQFLEKMVVLLTKEGTGGTEVLVVNKKSKWWTERFYRYIFLLCNFVSKNHVQMTQVCVTQGVITSKIFVFSLSWQKKDRNVI